MPPLAPPDAAGLRASRGLSRSARDWLVLGLIAACTAWLFREVVFHGRVFFFRDFGLFFYPKRFLAAAAARRLEVPLWESLSAGGGPILGAYQAAFFYPGALVYYILPMPWSFGLFVVLHFFIAGAGTYCMLRAWDARRAAAAVGALAWALSPSLVSIVDNVSFLTALAWLPWCMAFAKRLLDGGGRAAFVGLVASFAMCILAGAPEPVIFTAAFVTALAGWRLVAGLAGGGARAAARRGCAVLGALVVATLISGVELAPFLYLLRHSARLEGIDAKMAGFWSMAPTNIASWVLPRFYLQPGRGGVFWPDQGWLKSLYVGAAVPILAVWAVAAARKQREFFFAAAAVVAVALALGPLSPAWRFLFNHAPGFGLIRYPVKFFLPAAFAFAALAAFAVDEMIARSEARRAGGVYACAMLMGAAAALFLALYQALGTWPEFFTRHVLPPDIPGPGKMSAELVSLQYLASQWSLGRSALVMLTSGVAIWAIAATTARRAAAALLGAILVVDLALFADTLNPVTGPRVYSERPYHLNSVETGPGAGRLLATPQFIRWRDEFRIGKLAGVGGLVSYLAAVKGPEFASPEAARRWAEDVTGRRFAGADEFSVYMEKYQDGMVSEMAQFELNRETFYPNLHLLFGVPATTEGDVLLVRWTARLLKRLDAPVYDGGVRMERLFAASRVVDADRQPPHFKYRNAEEGRARASLVYEVAGAADDDAALEMITADGFDPSKTAVLLAGDADAAKRDLSSGGGATAAAGAVKWIADAGNSLAIETTSSRPALLYVADAFYPAFAATVDGAAAPLYRANYAFRAVSVPAGTHRVEMSYRPVDLYAGCAATGLGLAILAWVALARRRGTQAKAAQSVAPALS